MCVTGSFSVSSKEGISKRIVCKIDTVIFLECGRLWLFLNECMCQLMNQQTDQRLNHSGQLGRKNNSVTYKWYFS